MGMDEMDALMDRRIPMQPDVLVIKNITITEYNTLTNTYSSNISFNKH